MDKKFLVGFFVAGLVTIMVISTAYAKISASGHDFSDESWSGHEICKPCHTPHNAKSNTNFDAPLWNHALTTATFETYKSPSFNATVGQPSPSSKACLSCHDGTVALNSFGSSEGSSIFAAGALRIGSDISNDHPVSFEYNSELVTKDKGLRDPTTETIASMLIGGKVECASCHDVHASKGNSAAAGGKLLVVTNSGSALCLTCHNK